MHQSSSTQAQRALTLYGRSITRTTVIYALGLAAIVPFGIISLAVTTRYVDPRDYGRLAVLYAFATGLTLLCNLGSIQGTTMWVYGAAEDGDVDVIDSDQREVLSGREKREIMGTGLLLTIASCALASAACVVLLDPLNDVLVNGDSSSDEIRWAIASGAAGAPWRLVQNVFRFERRPVAFSVVSGLRPGLVVVLTIVLLAAGYGVAGVLAATAIGTGVATLIAFAWSRSSYALKFRPAFVPEIYRRGRRYVPVTIGGFVQSNADVFVLSHAASLSTLGLYRVALRIGTLPSYVTHSFLMAWAPLERSPLALANKRLRGKEAFASTLYTWLIILTLALLVAVTLSADALIHIAAPAYAPAALLIPFAAGAVTANVVFYGFFRAALFRRRMTWFAILMVGGAAVYPLLANALVPSIGARGVALASIATSLGSAGVLIALNQRSEMPLPMQWRRMALASAAAVCLVAAALLPPLHGPAHSGWAILVMLAFPVVLVRLRIVPAHLLGQLAAVARGALPDRQERKQALALVHGLPDRERLPVIALVGLRLSPADAAADIGTSQELALTRMTRGLRLLATAGPKHPADHAVGMYLVDELTTTDRDDAAVALERQGIALTELNELEAIFRLLRKTPKRTWRSQFLGPAPVARAAGPTTFDKIVGAHDL